jgi:hypothetical protein
MSAIGWAFLPFEVFFCLAEAAFFTALAVVCVRTLWKVLRYRRTFIWQQTLRDYRKRGHEPAFPELEGR